MRLIPRIFMALIGLVVLSAPLHAQQVLLQTTLSAALDGSASSLAVAAATGITAPGTGSGLTLLAIDREIVAVRTVNGTALGVTRGYNATRATPHISGAIVTIGPPQAFLAYIPAGQCTRTTLAYVPFVVSNLTGFAGDLYDCLGLTVNGQWTQVSANGSPTMSTTVASAAGVITLTGSYTKVSGALAVTGITVPAGALPGFAFTVEPTGAFTWTTAGNILVAGTAVVGRILTFTWNGAKWVASYV